MASFTRHMRQDVTYWPVTGTDGFGGFLYGTPVLLKGRWEDKAELYRNAANEEVVSSSVVYLSVDVDVGDILAEGDHVTVLIANPMTLNTTETVARRIEQRNRTTDLRNLTSLRKVFL